MVDQHVGLRFGVHDEVAGDLVLTTLDGADVEKVHWQMVSGLRVSGSVLHPQNKIIERILLAGSDRLWRGQGTSDVEGAWAAVLSAHDERS